MRAILAFVIVLMASLGGPPPAGAETQVQYSQPTVPLALFYLPPKDSTSLTIVAEQFALAIFTHGDERYRDQLREAGFAGPILQYLVANEASGPADSGTRRMRAAIMSCPAMTLAA